MSLVEENKSYATESGHFYWPDGRTAYTVPYKDKKRNGEERATTVRDAKELGLYPSVTTIMKVMSKGDALTNWMKRKVAEAAYEGGNPGELESMEAYTEYVLQKAEEAMTAQRDKGSRDHGIVEEYFRLLTEPRLPGEDDVLRSYTLLEPVKAVLAAFKDLGIEGQHVASEKSFACDLGYGGRVDVVINDPKNRVIVDFKFVDRLDKKKDYPEKSAQGAAYLYLRWGDAGLRDGRFVNIFVSTDTYEYEIREWTYDELQQGWNLFQAAFQLWKVINRYNPCEQRI